ncbi:TSC22 domain family protein 2 isoform X3 [Cynoglossus semilaevis]|uniref:TSC22 domain family protein 2 isoform X3 n=1 Tax=Cynoglossus semilaevis TaxID=244447 RepID=UPI000D6301E7|nr:TSC22 domain family protein 2 isoform X3 [Cynoglossus semilaevis]
MSKLSAKKKSCFQITSVTQAQVAASSITDDTESLDDPDESRTEDVSSEIFDVSRDPGACDRSSSEETLNNVGETQESHTLTTGPVNGGFSFKSLGTGRVTPHNGVTRPHNPLTINNTTVTTSVAHTAPVSTSCSSRFRVIKLDHGTGEPFRRGRWTCTEFYEKDSDSNIIRTADSIKPTVTFDHSIDRDSGLGTTGNSLVTSCAFSAQTFENNTDSGFSLGQPSHVAHPSELQHQGYSLAPQIGNGSSAFRPTGYTATASQQANMVSMQPAVSQNTLSNSINGVHHGAMQQSPIMPPATQPQQFPYSTHPTGLTAGQPDYRQQHFGSSTQNLPLTNLSVVPPTSQVVSSASNATAIASFHLGSGQQQPVSQNQPSGGIVSAPPAHSVISATTTTSSLSSSQNVPASVPSTTNTPPGVPIQTPGTGGLAQPQGSLGATTGLPSGFINHAEDGRSLKSDTPSQPGSVIAPGKDAGKPSIGETFNLPTPTVNSLFGIQITIDGNADEESTVVMLHTVVNAFPLTNAKIMCAVSGRVCSCFVNTKSDPTFS